jgi:hypothetical protein
VQTEVSNIILLEELKILHFSRVNCKSIMGNYLMPFKEEKKQKYLSP